VTWLPTTRRRQAHGDIDQIKYDDWLAPEAGPGETLIRTRARGLNYLDLFVLTGMPGWPVKMPRVSGGDIAGDLAALDEGVSGIEIGRRALVDPALGCCPSHAIGENTTGDLCKLIAVPAENLIPLADDISYEEAASLPIAYGTARRLQRVDAGVRVAACPAPPSYQTPKAPDAQPQAGLRGDGIMVLTRNEAPISAIGEPELTIRHSTVRANLRPKFIP
jgi:hypothetical protein